MRKYINQWPYDDYAKVFELVTGAKLIKEEKEYLSEFTDISKISASKIIYYDAIFMLKRWVPRFLVLYFTTKKTKQHFLNSNAPTSIVDLHKEFAKLTLIHAVKTYCKAGE